MAIVNEAFLKLKENYVFSEVSERLEKYKLKNPKEKVISLGVGDVTLPLTKSVITAMNTATDEMARKETFRGYGIVQGYDFLIDKILEFEYNQRGITLEKDEIFIGARSKRRFSTGFLNYFLKKV